MRRFAFALAVMMIANAAQCGLAEDTSKADEEIAQAIVASLREHQEAGRLKGFDIDLNVEDGRVALTGNVANEKQHQLAIDAARFAPGVKVVVNDLKIKGQTHEHPAQQKRLGANLMSRFQNQRPQQGGEASGLLTGLRNAWSQPNPDLAAAPQQAQPQADASDVDPIADAMPPAATAPQRSAPAIPEQATGEKIDQLANPNPLTNDQNIAGGYSSFTQGKAQTPVATVDSIKGPAQEDAPNEQSKPEVAHESVVAAPAAPETRSQLSRWEPGSAEADAEKDSEVAQAVANGETETVQPASASTAAQTQAAQASQSAAQQLAAQQAAQQQAAQQQAALQQAAQQQAAQHVARQQQGQAFQVIPVPVPTYPQMRRSQQTPVAYTASRLPGGQRSRRGHVRMAQATSPEQVQPAPQFIQGTGSGMAPARYDHPHMPGYAWPSYASYPNYAALQYPKQYSAHAWPYIGPFYPYPQVPLGWRKVTLSWDDGWWFLDFKDRGYGPYVTR